MDTKRQMRRAYALRETMLAMKPPLVLVAEDDPDVRRLVTTALRMDGCSVVEAQDGTDLLEQIGSVMLFGHLRGELDPVSLVISDICMNGHDGLEILAYLRRSEVAAPVILMTAHGDPAMQSRAEELGVEAFLRKPFEIDHLRGVVQQILARGDAAPSGG